MYDLYLTSTFTHEWNRGFNPKIGDALENAGFKCYLPHRDTDQTESPEVKFKSDIAAIENSKMILAVGLHESPNWGAEVGYAYGKNKTVVCLTNDMHEIPLICNGMINETVRISNLDDINTYIDNLSNVIRKYL